MIFMKKVALISPTGMLGSMVFNVFKDCFDLVLIYRDEKKLQVLNNTYGNVGRFKLVKFDFYNDFILQPENRIISVDKLVKKIGSVDAVINCSGILPPVAPDTLQKALIINTVLPQLLSNFYLDRFIHITTDCVYNGLSGISYLENSPKSPVDYYGLTKSLGEPSTQSLVLRTSIIGPELIGSKSLLEWFRRQKGKVVHGYCNHIWNGVTTKQYGIICKKIILEREHFPKNGLFHIFSSTLSKYEILVALNKKYQVHALIKPFETKISVNRSLATLYDFCSRLKIPDFETMLNDL